MEVAIKIPAPPPPIQFELWKIKNLKLLLVHYVLLYDMIRSLPQPIIKINLP